MKTSLRIAIFISLCAATALSAQAPVNKTILRIHQGVSPTFTLNPADPSAQRNVGPGQNVQMVTCTDKVTYCDRNPQANQDVQFGGTAGWTILFQCYPGYTGQVTQAFATLKKYTASCPVRIAIWALDVNNQPTGGYLANVDATVNTAAYTEFGGNLSTSPNVTNGFAVGVFINSSTGTDSCNVALHNDPSNHDFAYLFDGTNLLSANNDFGLPSDFLMRPKISYTAPTETAVATPSSGCAGTPINFNLNETGTPSLFSTVWMTTNPFTWAWNFGDAGTSTVAAPSHSYATAGTYTASGVLTIPGWTTTCACAPGTATVTINGTAPSVSITASANPVCPNGTSNFMATPTNGGTSPTYVWKINGIQVGTGPTYSGSTWAANDAVTCEMVSNAACAPSNPVVSNTIIMYLQPLAFSSYNYVATGLSVSFTATAANAVTWAWNFGDAGTSASSTPVHNYASPGTYTVDLTVTNSCGQTNVSSINITVSASGNSSGGNTGIHEKELEVNVNAFPNPVNNDLNVDYSINHTTDVTIEVMNTMGQVVSAQAINATSTGTAHVSMENMAAGLYFVRFKAGENNVQTMRIVHE